MPLGVWAEGSLIEGGGCFAYVKRYSKSTVYLGWTIPIYLATQWEINYPRKVLNETQSGHPPINNRKEIISFLS